MEGVWRVLVGGGWVELTSTRARLGGDSPLDGWDRAETDPTAFRQFGIGLIVMLVAGLLLGEDGAGEDQQLLGGSDTVMALLHASCAEGLVLPPRSSSVVEEDVDEGEEDWHRFLDVREDLLRLSRYGLLARTASEDGVTDSFEGGPALWAAMGTVLQMLSEQYQGPAA